MARMISILILALLCCGVLSAQKDDFKRERNSKTGEAKDAIEGKAPPALQVKSWLNTNGKALKLSDFKGKVVVLDFWGTW